MAYPARIIPAYAGLIDAYIRLKEERRDHPRIRGTNDPVRCPNAAREGSSPHTRD